MNATLKILSVATCMLLLFEGCKEKAEDLEFTAASLNQTRWKGTFTEINYDGGARNEIRKSEVGFFFVSESKVNYSIFWKHTNNVSELNDYEYAVKDKIVSFNAVFIRGNWLLTDYDGKKMILEKGTTGERAYRATLELIKVE